ncbi:capsular exopolysaccharide synthesis family protein [Mucilaginibacter frigoritolerans]|uniref:non-specific protein-tyrosine kinase n=1 Tax=Mucilaginibacter frigoritolerans TaxID=652788 RepID=A0A562UFU0_9SPHI|nr:polysaccharide biosynthesis tyrosine autokinase [Mucilaginibacter frigoritolerans]TWJ04613.1 capsular exopolysaccharide synthesis family protein [Mucilaginibacter frigoritolerans]
MSNQLQNTNNNYKDFTEEESFDYKELLGKIISSWYIFVFSIAICVSLSILYLRYATPDYKITSKLLVQDEKSSPSGGPSNAMMTDFSSLFDLPSNAQNEIDIIKSRSLMEKVVEQLKLNLTIFRKGRFKSDELFYDSPFEVSLSSKTDSISSALYEIKIAENGVINVLSSQNDININTKFDDSVKLKEYSLIFKKILPKVAGTYLLSIIPKDNEVEALSKSLDVQLSDKQSTTIDIAFIYPVAKKGEVILQSLMNNYIQSNLENKVQTADSTVAFIDRRLIIVQKELSGVEKDFEGFKKENNLANIEEQSKALVTGANDYFNQLNVIEIQLSVINDLEKYVTNPANKNIIPSSLTDQDPVFADAIGKYNDLLIERSKMELSYKEDNPLVKSLDNQISEVKSNLIKSFEAYKKGLSISKKELVTRNSLFTNQIKSAPGKERVFLDYSRQQTLKQELYLYLLQKREETMLTKTSTISSTRIIDNAKSDRLPIKPNRSLIHLIGLALGILLPFIFLYFKSALTIRIFSKQDIEKHTQIPIVAEIGNNIENKNLVVVENSRSVISEQFRSLRTNLQYLIKQNDPQIIMLTSSMSGEGKTFISLNLGSTLAITGKKVLFMELDLRKPKLTSSLGLENLNGFTNCVVSENNDLDSYIRPLTFSENCFLMSSGPIPPNPAEILLNEKVPLIFAELKKKFDFIIIDSPPVGLVADSLLLEDYVNLSLYVVRQAYTFKSQLDILNKLVAEKKLKHAYLVVNDIATQKVGYYGYGYGYGHGYGYGDYIEGAKPTFFERINSWFKKKK